MLVPGYSGGFTLDDVRGLTDVLVGRASDAPTTGHCRSDTRTKRGNTADEKCLQREVAWKHSSIAQRPVR